jgi:hypothetical protein
VQDLFNIPMTSSAWAALWIVVVLRSISLSLRLLNSGEYAFFSHCLTLSKLPCLFLVCDLDDASVGPRVAIFRSARLVIIGFTVLATGKLCRNLTIWMENTTLVIAE